MSMNYVQLAAQCVFPRLNVKDYLENADYRGQIIELTNLGVGGFCVFEGNTETARRVCDELQAHAETPLLFCADFEYGTEMRLDDGNGFPHAYALGVNDNAEETREVGELIATEANALGVHWNLAPVCDVNSNPKNPVIGIRSFGADPDKVARHSAAFITGTQKEKVLACAKHFPGHGDTDADSHISLPEINKSLQELEECEFIPFSEAINAGVRSVMLAHLHCPAIEPSGMPVSLSKSAVKLLRDRFLFSGLIVTDALDMGAISQLNLSDIAAELALEAGVDVALMPAEPLNAINSIASRAESDEKFANMLSHARRRIIGEKRYCGLMPAFAKLESDSKLFLKGRKRALAIAVKSLRTEGDLSLLPIDAEAKVAGFALLQSEGDLKPASRFFTMLAQAIENDCDFGFIDGDVTAEQIEDFAEGSKDSDIVLFPVFFKSRAGVGSLLPGPGLLEAVEKLSKGKRSIVALFGTPEIKSSLPGDLTVLAFSDSFPSLAAAVVKLTGREAFVEL